MAHHDRRAGGSGRRLVYGGHTIGIAAGQATRVLPNLVTIVAWHGCDHLAPVYEDDTLYSELELEEIEPLEGGGGLVHLRSRVRAQRGEESSDVLDWRFVAVMA
jgi:acyl dehydratase